jgi:hypothetical protein
MIEGCTFVENNSLSEEEISSQIYSLYKSLRITNSIIAHSDGLSITIDEEEGVPIIECTDIWDNDGGNWTGNIESLKDSVLGNIEKPPMFELPSYYEFIIDSPCINAECGRMGAIP